MGFSTNDEDMLSFIIFESKLNRLKKIKAEVLKGKLPSSTFSEIPSYCTFGL